MKKTESRYDAIVIGAGAAGLVCAGYAAKRKRKVLLLEKMERPGRKLLVTGKGRCNVTNNCAEDQLIASVRTNGRFLYSTFSAFNAQDTMSLIESLGVPLKTERGGRVFPKSDRSMDIVDALVHFTKSNGVISRNEQVSGLIIENAQVKGVSCISGEQYMSDNVVLATGGMSYPLTGSTGDGYKFAEQAGHTVTPLRSSLIPIETEEKWCSDLMGLSLKNVVLRLCKQGKKKAAFEDIGEMLFTHFGVSGPLVLSASAHMAGNIADYTLEIDLKPALSEQQLDARIQRDFQENLNRDFINSLGALLPRKLIPVVVQLCGIDQSLKVNQITREQRLELVRIIKHLRLTPRKLRPIEEAVITSGGVKVSEIDPRTMESKCCTGLYLAGELIDVDAYTGGYNLQIAFSTGYLAGQNV